MELPLRFRLSLLWRMGVAAAVLASFTAVVVAITGVFGALVGATLLGGIVRWFEVVSGLPHVSAIAPVPAPVVFVAAIVGIVVGLRAWGYATRFTPDEHLLQPSQPVAWAFLTVLLGCLYLLVVEGTVAAGAAVAAIPSQLGTMILFLGAVALLVCWASVAAARREVGRLREAMIADSVPAGDVHPDVRSTAHRLAQIGDVPPPAVYVTGSDRPESFTVGTGSDAVLVVSSGLLDALSAAEIEAVLAHEVSHLANGDSRLMGAALVPVLIADDWIDESPSALGDRLWNALFGLVKWYGQFGVAVLSRGREWGADAGAAALTGAPATFASALRRLDDARGRPETDLREWEQSVGAMDILPPAEGDRLTGPFDTHPPTDERIERLQRRVRRAERR